MPDLLSAETSILSLRSPGHRARRISLPEMRMPTRAGLPAMTCPNCHGRGWYNYDHHHLKPCEGCCLHNQGVWLLLEYYGDHNWKWCCSAGCGAIWDGIVDYQGARR